MRIPALLLSALASAPMLLGQPRNASVEGRVVNALNGSPVRRATVALRLARPASPAATVSPAGMQTRVETDDQGRFAFRDLAPGGYVCLAERQGFLNEDMYPRSRPAPILMLGDGQQVAGLVVRMTPQAVIAGKVVDRLGEPVQMAQVLALRWTFYGGRRQLSNVIMGGPIVTNDLGEYRIPSLPPGSYYIAASPPQAGRISAFGSDSRPPETVVTTTYYPGAADVSAATQVRVEAGSETRAIDIKLAEVKAYTVRGRVIDSAAPQSRTPVPYLVRQGVYTGFLGYTTSQPDGRFLIVGVPAGAYHLVVSRPNEQGSSTPAAAVPLEIKDRNVEGIEIKVEPAVEIQGAVRNEGAQPCMAGNVSLSAEIGGYHNANLSGGAFSLKGVARGAYQLNVQPSGPCYARSIRFGGREVIGQSLTVDGPGALEIVLAAADSTIEGTVADASGKPLEATVVLVAKDGGQGARPTYSNRRGVFSVFALRPGAYELYAFEAIDYASALSPDYLRQLAGRGANVTVAAGERAGATLTAIPASATGEKVPIPQIDIARGSIEGRVVNAATGAPVGGVKVSLSTRMRARESVPEATAETDAQGRFAFPDLDPDVYNVGVEKQGFLTPSSDTIVVGNGQKIAGRTVAIEPQAVITGRVQDEYGDPVTNADVGLYRAEMVAGVRRLYRIGSARTDDLGKFRLAGLTAGSYDLAVSKRQMQRSTGDTGLPIVWSNGVAVGPGAEVPIEMVMRRTRVFRIRGTLVDEQDRPLERQQAIGLSPRGIGTALTIGNPAWLGGGAFELSGVPPGAYVLWARPGEAGPASRMGLVSVEVRDADLEGVRVRLSAGKEIRGRVTWDGDTPYRFGTVSVEAVEGYTANGQFGNEGGFRLAPIWPVPYLVRLNTPCPTCYVKSIRYGGREVRDTYVAFEGDGALEITASPSGGIIVGTAPAGVTVKLEGAGKVVEAKADSQGTITFNGLAPGAYKLTAGSRTIEARVEANGRAEVKLN